jgi:DnaJ-class molecular chaperone
MASPDYRRLMAVIGRREPTSRRALAAAGIGVQRRQDHMNEKVPAPCEHCAASGLFHGSECVECRGKGYRMIQGPRILHEQAKPKR